MALAWYQHPALHKLSEEWSFCVGDGARQGFPLVAASPGFERLTMRPRGAFLGKKCGDVLGSGDMNPKWLIDRVREAVQVVASGQSDWADFLVMNRRGDMSCFPNYVRIAMLNTLTGFPDPATERMMLALQVDASGLVQQFQVEATYFEKLVSVRSKLPWPEELKSCETTLQLTQFVKLSARSELAPTMPTTAPGALWEADPVHLPSPRESGETACDAASVTLSWPGSHPSLPESQSAASIRSDCSDDSRIAVCAVAYRHTTGNFQTEVLKAPGLQHCVGPRSIPNGPLVFAEDEATHLALCMLAKDFHPRHVLVEAKLMPVLSKCTEHIKGNRGRKVNEKCRQMFYV